MTQYLGICMVIVVIGIVLAVLARLMTSGILEEIERIKKRRFESRCKVIAECIMKSSEYVEKYMKNVKEGIEMDKNLGKEEAQKRAADGFKKTINEIDELDFLKK